MADGRKAYLVGGGIGSLAAAVYLASDDAAWTTGQYLAVDGGYTIR